MQLPIYLDYAATTPVDPRVAEAMCDCLTMDGNFGNPASRSHIYGWRAEEAVEDARGQIASLLNADPREVVWTSGATESNNLALKGAVQGYLKAHPGKQPGDCHIITSAAEHKAVLDACVALEDAGVEVTYLAPDASGRVLPEQVQQAFTENTILVSLMLVNNEVGAVNTLEPLGTVCRDRGILLHVDAAQAVGKLGVDVKQLKVDLLSVSAHKFYGPKGIGALYVRRTNDFSVMAQIHGGGHERKMRSGTLATHQIVGFGEAARIAADEMDDEFTRLRQLRERFWHGVSAIEGVAVNGELASAFPGIINLQFAGVDGENLMMGLRELAISSGSACTSASVEPSYVLKAMGVSDELAHSSLRFGFGRFTQTEEIDFAIEKIHAVVKSLRNSSANFV